MEQQFCFIDEVPPIKLPHEKSSAYIYIQENLIKIHCLLNYCQ